MNSKKPKTLSKATTALLAALAVSVVLAPAANAECGGTQAPYFDRVHDCVNEANETGQGAAGFANEKGQWAIGEANEAAAFVLGTASWAVGEASEAASGAITFATTTAASGVNTGSGIASGAVGDAEEAYQEVQTLPQRTIDFVQCQFFTGPEPCALPVTP